MEPGEVSPETLLLPEIFEGDSTVVVAVALSLPGEPSGVDDVMVAVFEIIELGVEVDETVTFRVKTEVPTLKDGLEQEIVPLSPASGVVHDQPGTLLSDTKKVPAGSVSDQVALVAGSGPLLLSVIV